MQRRGYDLALSYIGPYLFFSGLTLLDKYHEIKEGPITAVGSTTHPSNADRQAMLNHVVAFYAPKEQLETAIELQRNLDLLVGELLSRVARRA